MTTPEDPHERAARWAREYRVGGPTSLLRQIGDHGNPGLAHDLQMERTYRADPERRAEYAARVDGFLNGG